jgi:hypothetical protein
MADPTEAIRRQLAVVINESPRSRELLEAKFGQVWDPDQLQEEFDVVGFRAPFVVATRRSDHRLGSLLFQNAPRFYFAFVPDGIEPYSINTTEQQP